MKKLVVFMVLIFIILSPLFAVGNVFATMPESVKVITTCNIYSSPKLNYGELEEGIVFELSFGDVLTVNGTAEGEDSDFDFYEVFFEKEGIEYTGFVITNFVIDAENVPLARTLDPNAKALNQAQIYKTSNESDKLIIAGDEIVLDKYENIKIVDGYDRTKVFHKILFEEDGVIYTGYIKTADLLVEGINSTVILVILIFVLVGSIVLSIVITTRKKRKKQAKKLAFLGK